MKKFALFSLASIMLANATHAMEHNKDEEIPREIKVVQSYPFLYTGAALTAICAAGTYYLANDGYTVPTALAGIMTLVGLSMVKTEKTVVHKIYGDGNVSKIAYYGENKKSERTIATLRERMRERNEREARAKQDKRHDDNADTEETVSESAPNVDASEKTSEDEECAFGLFD